MKKYALMLIILLLVSSCAPQQEELYKESYLDIFDTHSQIMLYAKSDAEFDSISKEVKVFLDRYNTLFDIYHNYEGVNNLKTINDNAGIKPVKVDKDIIEIIKRSKEIYAITDGNVNIAFGPVLTIWHKARMEGIDDPKHARLPDTQELQQAKKLTNIKDVIIDEQKSTVFLKRKGMKLDVGSIAKGYVADALCEHLVNKGHTRFLLNIGGNIKTYGAKADGSKWTLAIQNPNLEEEKKYIEKIYLNTNSLVTSGDYQRFYIVGGKNYHHIINKDTLMPSNTFKSVSVICNDSTYADAMSTALFNMSFEEGYNLAKKDKKVEVLWILQDMSIQKTSGFTRYNTK